MSRELKPKGNNVRECPLELFCAGEAMSYNLSQDVFLYYQFGLCQIFWSQFQLLTNGNLTCLNLLVEKLSTILLSANFETSNKLSTAAISLWLFL